MTSNMSVKKMIRIYDIIFFSVVSVQKDFIYLAVDLLHCEQYYLLH